MTVFTGLAYACWGVFVATWLIGAAYNVWRAPRTVGSRTRADFMPGWLLGGIALSAVTRLVPRELWAPVTYWNLDLAIPGAVLLVASTLLALWARVTLGRMWSSVPTVKEHHELRTDGPYRITRHPIYTGILGMLLGSAMMAGFGSVLIPLIVVGGIFVMRIPREEKLMTDTFGERYIRYQHDVPPLVPFLRI